MDKLFHWLMVNASILSVLVTVAVIVFLSCCLKCCDCSHRETDNIFKRHDA